MPRTKKPAALEDQITKAQEKVEKAKSEYDAACAELKSLLAECEARRQKLLMAAIAKSNKSFDDILHYIESN